MYIVNTTFMVSAVAHGKWYQFMTDRFIPSLKTNPAYGERVFTRLLSEQTETFFTYSLQIHLADLAGYNEYTKKTFPEYQEFASALFDAETTHFISLMKVIDLA